MIRQRGDKPTIRQASLVVFAPLLLFVLPEVLIFGFSQDARDNWVRMLPVAVFGTVGWSVAIMALCSGVYALFAVDTPASAKCMSLALIYPGVRVPAYWIKNIVVDGVPAFGDNAENIYAVAGLDTLVLGVLWAIHGAAIGLVLLGIVSARR